MTERGYSNNVVSPGELTETSPGVFYCGRDLVVADPDIVEFLKQAASLSKAGRSRLCAHPDPSAEQHDMLIVASSGGYVGPHRHPGKTESFLIVEGECDILLFDDEGVVTSVFPMGQAGAGFPFFYRMPAGRYHALGVRSDFLVFVESAKGPFDARQVENAPWAPPPNEVTAGRRFLAAAKDSFEGRSPKG